MNANDTETLERQRQRRERINRIKTGIILTISIWILVSLLAIIVLTVQVVLLNRRVSRLEERVNQIENSGNTLVDSEKNPPVDSEEDSGSTQDGAQKESLSYDNVVTGIDTPDNMADEGDEHFVYLTFDGSPNANTDVLLDKLGEYGVKATFFVVGDESEEMQAVYKRIVDEGHTLGMHSYSNQYSTVYESTDAFLADYQRLSDYLERVTGVQSKFYRFPGGSSNEISNVNMAEFVHLLNEKGIKYFDWNVSAGDSAADYSVQDIVSNVTEGVSKYKTSVVLLHDGENKSTTAEAIGPLIEALRSMGAQVLPIDEETRVIQYIKAESVE